MNDLLTAGIVVFWLVIYFAMTRLSKINKKVESEYLDIIEESETISKCLGKIVKEQKELISNQKAYIDKLEDIIINEKEDISKINLN